MIFITTPYFIATYLYLFVFTSGRFLRIRQLLLQILATLVGRLQLFPQILHRLIQFLDLVGISVSFFLERPQDLGVCFHFFSSYLELNLDLRQLLFSLRKGSLQGVNLRLFDIVVR